MKKRGIVGFVALALVFAAGAALAVEGTTCGQAAAWVAAHAGQLPATYDEIATYPPGLRRAILAALPAEAQSRVWREHLERWLESRPGLEARQRAVIEEGMRMLDAGLFRAADDPVRRQDWIERLASFEERALGVLGAAELRGAFVDFGGVEPAADVQPHVTECDCTAGDPAVVQACPEGTRCKTGGCSNPSGAGCGLFTYLPCDGVCVAKAVEIDPIEAP